MQKEVTYRDHDHTYWAGTVRYTSATQLVDRFKQKFDTKEKSQYMEERYSTDAETWRDRWDDNRDRSLVRGNAIHNRQENIVINRGMEVHNGRVLPVPNPALLPAQTPLIQYPDGIYTEVLLWSHRYRLAGRCDKLIIETIQGVRYADIDDYKSNRVIKSRGFRNPDGTRQMMKPPIEHLEDCSRIHYELQLSGYHLMLEEQGFVARQRRVIHFPHILSMAPPGAPPPPPVIHIMPYRKSDVISMAEYITTNG